MKYKPFDFDCAVIGAGPAGLVSTLYLRRFKRSVLLINSGTPRALWIPETHNLIGFDQGVSGRELLSRLKRQIKNVGCEVSEGQAHLKALPEGFAIQFAGQTASARRVILATGVDDIDPELDNLLELRRKGLLRYCPVCDAYEYRNRAIACLVQDESGIRRALFMQPFAKKLSVIMLKSFSISAELKRELLAADAQVYPGGLIGIEPSSQKPGCWIHIESYHPFFVTAVYVELGVNVRESAFHHLGLARTREGYLRVRDHQKTSMRFLYAAGDCVDGLSQIGVAAGQAAIAATSIHNDLRKKLNASSRAARVVRHAEDL